MRLNRPIVACAAAIVASLLVAALAQASQAPSDFAIRFVGGLCSGDGIDTFNGTYTRHIDDRRTASAKIDLSPSERQQVFELVAGVGLLAYPETFDPPARGFTIPAPSHVITVRAAGVEHTVRWTDIGSVVPEAVRLRQFVADVYARFRNRPEVQQLPKQESFCL
jgi:hypothetical protein